MSNLDARPSLRTRFGLRLTFGLPVLTVIVVTALLILWILKSPLPQWEISDQIGVIQTIVEAAGFIITIIGLYIAASEFAAGQRKPGLHIWFNPECNRTEFPFPRDMNRARWELRIPIVLQNHGDGTAKYIAIELEVKDLPTGYNLWLQHPHHKWRLEKQKNHVRAYLWGHNDLILSPRVPQLMATLVLAVNSEQVPEDRNCPVHCKLMADGMSPRTDRLAIKFITPSGEDVQDPNRWYDASWPPQ